jgi:hypothetical protein
MQFHRLAGALLAALSFGSVTAAAQPASGPISFEGSVGLEGYYHRYREPSNALTNKGWFGGITADGRAQYERWQLRGDVRLAFGETESRSNGTVDIDNKAFEGRLAVGHVVPLGSAGDQIIPYVGYGYRRFKEDLESPTTSTGGRTFDSLSQYHYVPIGVEGLYILNAQWSLKPTLEYDHLLYGTQDNKLSQAGTFQDGRNSQNHGWGARGSLFARTLVGSTPIEFGPFARYWHISNSERATLRLLSTGAAVGDAFEPRNNTVEAGLALKVWF